jgi:hypothetical protein
LHPQLFRRENNNLHPQLFRRENNNLHPQLNCYFPF